MLVSPSRQFILSHLKMPAMKTSNSLRSEPPAYVSGWSSFMPACINTDLSGSVCYPLANAGCIIQAIPLYCSDSASMWSGMPWPSVKVQTVHDSGRSLVPHPFMGLLCSSFEHRFYHPCCRTGYVGFSVQARFLNLVSAVLSLNSLCQFILCINNLLPWEVISFGVFYRLFCCLDHMIQCFSVTLCSVILWSFPMFGFSLWSSHSVHRCLLIQISLAILGRQPLGPSSGPLDGRHNLIALAAVSAKRSTTFFTLDANSSQVSSLSDLLVSWWHTERDHEWSSVSFHLEKRDVLSRSLGGSCPDPPCAVLSGTAFPLPLSGSMMSYSSLMSLILGDSCAPVFDPPPAGGGVVVESRSATLLVLSSRDCELMVMPVRFAPDCAPMLLFDCLGHLTFRFTIGCCHCEASLIELLCDELLSSPLLQ